MKKRVILFALTAWLSLAPAFSQVGNVAVGPVYSVNFLGIQSPLNGLGVTGKIAGLAPIFGLNFSFGSEKTFFGVTADWLLYRQPLYEPWNINFYVGPGFYSSVFVDSVTKSNSRFDLGLRIPFGINWTPLRFLEFFFEVTPAFGITFRDPVAPGWLMQGGLGARIWF